MAMIFPNHTASSVQAGRLFHMRCLALTSDDVNHDDVSIAWFKQDGDALVEVQTDTSER